MPANTTDLEKKLWASADQLRANSKLKAAEYSAPVLGLIFLRFVDQRFTKIQAQLEAEKAQGKRRLIEQADYRSRGSLFLPQETQFNYLLNQPESANIGKMINDAMKKLEDENPELAGVLPRNYTDIDNNRLFALLKIFSSIPTDVEGDFFGKIYEYFLSKFAMSEGQRGGEFFTPLAIVQLIVEIIEPFHGRIFDPACGSGGMFVQSARFVQNHQLNPTREVSIFGQEKTEETARLCRMNLAVNGLSGSIIESNSYYADPHNSQNRFDFVMANPPFNVKGVDKESLKGNTARYPFGMPRSDSANYLWIQLFYSALNERGRAGFVMANTASDARHSELDIRRALLKEHVVDVMVAIGSNFFYTVRLPCTLWFFDKGKRGSQREDTVLFIDARSIYQQIDRVHRDFKPDQIEFIANIVRLYRGEAIETTRGSLPRFQETFLDNTYADVAGLCKVATLTEIEEQGWSLNPGRYVGVAESGIDDFDFQEKLETFNEELETLNEEARKLEGRISVNIARLLEGKE